MNEFISVAEYAKLKGISRQLIYLYIRGGLFSQEDIKHEQRPIIKIKRDAKIQEK